MFHLPACQVLGKDSFTAIEPQMAQLPTLDTGLNAAVRRLLDVVRQERGRFMPVRREEEAEERGMPRG